MNIAWVSWAFVCLGLFALVGFLCWTLNSGWPCALLLLIPGVKTKRRHE